MPTRVLQLGRIGSPGDALSPRRSWVRSYCWGVFRCSPAGWLAGFNRRLYVRHRRPDRFEANLVVIGAGTAGVATACTAAASRAKVVLIGTDRPEAVSMERCTSRRRVRAGTGAHRLAVGRHGRRPDDHYPQYRHRHGQRAGGARDPGSRRRPLADSPFRPADRGTAGAPARAGRWYGRLRAGTGLPWARQRRDAARGIPRLLATEEEAASAPSSKDCEPEACGY